MRIFCTSPNREILAGKKEAANLHLISTTLGTYIPCCCCRVQNLLFQTKLFIKGCNSRSGVREMLKLPISTGDQHCKTVRADLAIFYNSWPFLGFAYQVLDKLLNLNWQFLMFIGSNLIVVNGQIFNKIWSHCQWSILRPIYQKTLTLGEVSLYGWPPVYFAWIQLLCQCWISKSFTCLVKYKPVKQEVSGTVMLPPMVSVLLLYYRTLRSSSD